MYPAAAAKALQSWPALCDPMDCSPPGSSVHGIFQARALEAGAIAFSLVHATVVLCPFFTQAVTHSHLLSLPLSPSLFVFVSFFLMHFASCLANFISVHKNKFLLIF